MKTLCPPSLLSPSSLLCSSLPILICILSVIDELPNDSSLSSTGMMAGIPCNLSPLVFVFKVPQATRGGIKEVVKMRSDARQIMTLRKPFSQNFSGQSVPQVWPFVEPKGIQ